MAGSPQKASVAAVSEPGLQAAGRTDALPEALIDLERHPQIFRSVLRIVFAVVPVLIVMMLLRHEPATRFIGSCLILSISAIAYFVQRAGQVRRAYLIFSWGVWSAVTVQATIHGGVVNPGLYVLPALMLLAGWLLSLQQAMAFGYASIFFVIALALSQEFGMLVPHPLPAPIYYGVSVTAILLMSLVAMRLFLKSHWDGLAEIRALNARLTHTVENLQAQEVALRRSEQRFAKVGLASPLPIAISALETGRYLDVNPAWERCFGWMREAALGKTSVELDFWPGDEERQAWLADLRRDGRTMDRDILAVTADGSVRNILLSAELIDYDGMPAVLAVMLDQTERRRIEEEVLRLNVDLEERVVQRTAELTAALETLQRAQQELVQAEKLAALGSLVAGVAHELNTPIGNALMAASTLSGVTREFASVLEQGALKRSQLESFMTRAREGAQLVERSLNRAADLVNSFKQVAVDQSSERRRPFDLGEVVGEVIDTLRPNLKRLPWQIEVEIPEGIELQSYPGPLGQIIINLVMNATMHAFEGRSSGRVRVTGGRCGDDKVELRCADDGIGIPAETVGRIFDPFFTTKLGKGGSGLGLSITHRLVTQVLGGQVSVESSSAGTAFTLRLPCSAPEAAT
jgi:PAS domain S-box-containing protein